MRISAHPTLGHQPLQVHNTHTMTTSCASGDEVAGSGRRDTRIEEARRANELSRANRWRTPRWQQVRGDARQVGLKTNQLTASTREQDLGSTRWSSDNIDCYAKDWHVS